MKKQQYFQASGKFHTTLHSFAFPKASRFPGGAAVAPSLSVLAWGRGAASQDELCWQCTTGSHSCLSPLICVGPVEAEEKLWCRSPKAELCSGLVFNGSTSQSKKHPFSRGTNVLPGFYWGAAEQVCCVLSELFVPLSADVSVWLGGCCLWTQALLHMWSLKCFASKLSLDPLETFFRSGFEFMEGFNTTLAEDHAVKILS